MERIASNEFFFSNSDKTGLVLMEDQDKTLEDQDKTFIPPKLDNFENYHKTYNILSKVNLDTIEKIDQFKENYLQISQCNKQMMIRT